jgi:hypothetical protein
MIASFIPLLIIKYADAKKLNERNTQLHLLMVEKTKIPSILINIINDVKGDDKKLLNSILTRIERKYKSGEISEEQYKELRSPISALIES